MMKKTYLFILLCILLFPNVIFASDVLSQTHSSLTLQTQEVIQDEPFTLYSPLKPKTMSILPSLWLVVKFIFLPSPKKVSLALIFQSMSQLWQKPIILEKPNKKASM